MTHAQGKDLRVGNLSRGSDLFSNLQVPLKTNDKDLRRGVVVVVKRIWDPPVEVPCVGLIFSMFF